MAIITCAQDLPAHITHRSTSPARSQKCTYNKLRMRKFDDRFKIYYVFSVVLQQQFKRIGTAAFVLVPEPDRIKTRDPCAISLPVQSRAPARLHETARVTDTPQRIRQIRVQLVEFDLRIGGTPPYPPPPDDRSELDYLNELITGTYWFCYAFMTHEQIDKLNEHESTMDPEVAVKVARDMYLVHVPRYLAQLLKKESGY